MDCQTPQSVAFDLLAHGRRGAAVIVENYLYLIAERPELQIQRDGFEMASTMRKGISLLPIAGINGIRGSGQRHGVEEVAGSLRLMNPPVPVKIKELPARD
jgi:hypothetical protein